MKDDTEADEVSNNGYFGEVSNSRFSSLLTSKDRDFLLSPNGAQVLSLTPLFPMCNSLWPKICVMYASSWPHFFITIQLLYFPGKLHKLPNKLNHNNIPRILFLVRIHMIYDYISYHLPHI
ncbi:hypothetical protein Lalb_Chr08g0246261 [Lupinus albus]|uniref:Uncharacterized protein n=1 Tax=Lupinus albus TaxID=3870 RepID=A0A6A4Q6E4_LUPAL|nr:hypothetical protein Lalb_Chr08g0246261 [Lupinus albus]